MAGGPFSSTFLCFAQKAAWDRRSTPPPYPFNLAIAALASICSAAPKSSAFRGPRFSQSSGGVNPPSGKKIPGQSREFCLDAPFGAARFRSQKRPGTDGALLRLIPSTWRLQPWPPSARPPPKAPLSGDPVSLHSSGGVNPPSGKKIPGQSREFCLDAPFGAARFRSQKRPGTDGALLRLIPST